MKMANMFLGNSKVKPDWCRLRDWLKRRCPEIVALQKIGPGEPSLEEDLRRIGYEGCFVHHDRYDRGVGILVDRDFLGRHNPPALKMRSCELPGIEKNESRFLTVSIGDLSVSSIYAPNPRPKIGPTVDWLNRLRSHVEKRAYACQDSVLCGDFNVPAIDDTSKWKLKRELAELKHLGFFDLYRKAHSNPEEAPGYTRGCGQKYPSRLHLVLASTRLVQRLRSACIEPESKLWPRKDAPPLIVDFNDA